MMADQELCCGSPCLLLQQRWSQESGGGGLHTKMKVVLDGLFGSDEHRHVSGDVGSCPLLIRVALGAVALVRVAVGSPERGRGLLAALALLVVGLGGAGALLLFLWGAAALALHGGALLSREGGLAGADVLRCSRGDVEALALHVRGAGVLLQEVRLDLESLRVREVWFVCLPKERNKLKKYKSIISSFNQILSLKEKKN